MLLHFRSLDPLGSLEESELLELLVSMELVNLEVRST